MTCTKGAPKHILIVDDNVELAENMMEILEGLEGADVRCHATSSAAAARAFCRTHEVALALVDVYLPDDNGTKLLTELKGHSEHAQVIVVTGDASLETAIAAVDGGAFSYVVKPFDPKQLIEKVTLALRQHALLCERKELRAELEASEARHRDVVENVPAFVLALDEHGKIVVWNRFLEQITGYQRDEMLGAQGQGLMRGDGDQRLPLKGGGHRWVRWQRAVVASAPKARLTYAIGVDVTDEREMLTRTLRSERLAAVGTLAAGLAHEVRNPLNSASLQLQVLERRISKGKTSVSELIPVVSLVKEEIHRLERLVADFLAFARPTQLQLGVHDLNQVVKGVADLIEPEAQQASVQLSIQLAPEVGEANLDPERFRQVLINLLRNAVEAAGAGGQVGLVTCRTDSELCVKITDSGPGFPPGAQIFDAFYTTKDGGTGLGLSIVHSLVSAHGGRVTAASEPGMTCFSVCLPL
ncbi:MAG: response regulator [Polyangiaceae bacterium]|nr:response regulator [Polyangiaceae bacterium]MCW5789385.1 response regulator [Polyangiaceae bacterium]